MQQIERYGVIALVFLLVTIVAISFWGDSKSPGFWGRLTGKNQPKKEEVAKIDPAVPPVIADPNLPLSQDPAGTSPVSTLSVGENPLPDALHNPALGNQPPMGPAPAPLTNGPSVTDVLTSGPVNPTPPTGLELSTTPPPARPARAAATEYVVQRGDSLARIARKQLGAESRWQEIANLNPTVDPKSLNVGQKLVMPEGAAPVASKQPAARTEIAAAPKPAPKKSTAKPAVASGRACTVQKGDTLRSIARRELGDERRWKEIASANPGIDPSKLAIGMRVKLPAKDAELLASASAPSSPAPKKGRVQ